MPLGHVARSPLLLGWDPGELLLMLAGKALARRIDPFALDLQLPALKTFGGCPGGRRCVCVLAPRRRF